MLFKKKELKDLSDHELSRTIDECEQILEKRDRYNNRLCELNRRLNTIGKEIVIETEVKATISL